MIVILGILVLCSCGRKTLQKSDLETVQDLYSYAYGFEVGVDLQQDQIDFNLEALWTHHLVSLPEKCYGA